MKRNKLVKYLEQSGCTFVREGGSHTLYRNPSNGKVSTVPRHHDVKEANGKNEIKYLTLVVYYGRGVY